MNRLPALLAAIAVTTALLGSTAASAQFSDEYADRGPTPEHIAVDLAIGAYQPSIPGGVFDTLYGNDRGPFVGFHIDILGWNIRRFGYLGASFGPGFVRYKGRACSNDGGIDCNDPNVTERTRLNLYPLYADVMLRIDALDRELDIPFVFTGRLGLSAVGYRARGGSASSTSGMSFGLHWSVQAAFNLDVLDRRAARRLDANHGINHSHIFVEAFGSTARSALEVNDPFALSGGLGLVF